MKRSIQIATFAVALSAAFTLTGCASGEFERNIEKIRQSNPLKNFGKKKKDPAPVTTGQTSGQTEAQTDVETGRQTSETAQTVPAVSAPSSTGYDMPVGGANTISLSVSSCINGCPVVNVLLDPDNYWQRSAPEGVTSGQGREGLYNEVSNIFQAEGFYTFRGELDIIKGNQSTCSDYQAGGQAFFISLSRNNARRRINFDTGCAGSASADAAADAINSLIEVRDFMSVINGQ